MSPASADPHLSRDAAHELLRVAGSRADDEIDLAETALVLGALDRPRVRMTRYRGHLSELGDAMRRRHRQRRRDSIEARIETLNAVIFAAQGYAGDDRTYDDLQNANLIRVIDRRRGLPISLGILYIHAARALGWQADGVNFPHHFLVRLDFAGERAIVDPFHGGRTYDAPDLRSLLKRFAGHAAELAPSHYEPAGARAVLIRLQNNIKVRLIRNKQPAAAAEIVERMLLFAPSEVRLLRELGLLHADAGNLGAAVSALDRFVADAQDDRDRHQTAALAEMLRRRLN